MRGSSIVCGQTSRGEEPRVFKFFFSCFSLGFEMRFNWKHRIVVPFLCRKWVKVNVREISELGEKPRHATNLNINVGPSFGALPTIVWLFSINIFSGKLYATYWSTCDRWLLTGISLLLSIQFYLVFHWLCLAVTVGAGFSRTSHFGAPTSGICRGVNFKWRISFLCNWGIMQKQFW